MDRKYIDDHHIIARYLADQLSDEECAAFEAYYLAHPDVVQEMEATARFKNGFSALARKQELEPLLSTADRRPFISMRLAAAVAALAITGLLIAIALIATKTPVMGVTVADVSSRFGTQLPASAAYDLIRVRSNRVDQRVMLPATPSAIHLRILPDEQSSTYRVTLTKGEEHIGTLDALVPDGEQMVNVFVNSAKLAPGLYELSVAPTVADADREMEFTIEVVGR